jgi:hypothetical protein
MTTRLASHASHRDVSAETRIPSSKAEFPSLAVGEHASSTCTMTWYRSPATPGSMP